MQCGEKPIQTIVLIFLPYACSLSSVLWPYDREEDRQSSVNQKVSFTVIPAPSGSHQQRWSLSTKFSSIRLRQRWWPPTLAKQATWANQARYPSCDGWRTAIGLQAGCYREVIAFFVYSAVADHAIVNSAFYLPRKRLSTSVYEFIKVKPRLVST